jgi:hypothetical protein
MLGICLALVMYRVAGVYTFRVVWAINDQCLFLMIICFLLIEETYHVVVDMELI